MKKTISLISFVPVFAIILCIFIYIVFARATIETHTWELSYAQQAGPPFVTIVHNKDYDFSDDDSTLFKFSKPIELTCVAKNGKLTITDKTNGNTYNGTYKVKSWNRLPQQRYEIVIEGKEGTANIGNISLFNRTLFMSIDGYYLNFNIK